jgi:dynein heavy chain
VAQYHEQEATLCGDVLLTAAFISYAGSFSKKYRRELLDNLWMPFLRTQKVSAPSYPESGNVKPHFRNLVYLESALS